MFSDLAYQAARHRAAFIDRSTRGRLIVSGGDRASYLHGLLTNEIASLKAGHGCYTAYLTPQGRMIADLWIYELGDIMLLSLAADVKATVAAKLDQFIFTEDVQVADATDSFEQIAVIGPDASRVLALLLQGASREVLDQLVEHGNLRARLDGAPVVITRVSDTGEPGYDLYVEQSRGAALKSALTTAGVPEADQETADTIRIESGVPLFHCDMDEETIPLEAGIESRAISFAKGCYVGQEVIIRILHRGHGRIAKKLVGIVFDEGAPPPASGAAVRAANRDIGRITSSAFAPALARPIALAYLQRDFLSPGTAVSSNGAPGRVAELPFVSNSSSSASAGGNAS